MSQDFLSDDLKAQMGEALTLQLRHLSSEDEELRRTAVQAVLTLVGAQHREHWTMRSSAGKDWKKMGLVAPVLREMASQADNIGRFDVVVLLADLHRLIKRQAPEIAKLSKALAVDSAAVQKTLTDIDAVIADPKCSSACSTARTLA